MQKHLYTMEAFRDKYIYIWGIYLTAIKLKLPLLQKSSDGAYSLAELEMVNLIMGAFHSTPQLKD